jgi:putative transposase
MVADGEGVSLGITVDAANTHDMKMTKATRQSKVVHRPEPTIRSKQHICMDKGYDFPEEHELLEDNVYTIHIRKKRENKRKRIATNRSRWRVVGMAILSLQ